MTEGKFKTVVLPNDETGHAALVGMAKGAKVAMEATGCYHVPLLRALEGVGVQAMLLNPKRARDLAKGLGLLSKTDKIDAKVLAQSVQMLGAVGPSISRSEAHDELRSISRLIQAYTEQRAEHKKRLATCSCEPAKASLQRQIAFLKEEIGALEKLWDKLVRQIPSELALSVPFVGRKTARVLISELPEDLSGLSPKQVASYVGVVPRENASGKRLGRATIGHTGNSRLRRGLFMAATLAAFKDQETMSFYARLRAKGRETPPGDRRNHARAHPQSRSGAQTRLPLGRREHEA